MNPELPTINAGQSISNAINTGRMLGNIPITPLGPKAGSIWDIGIPIDNYHIIIFKP